MSRGISDKCSLSLVVLSLLIFSVLLSGCISIRHESSTANTQLNQEIISKKEIPAITPKINQWNISDLANANNQFALDMFSELGGQHGNVFFSPWSIYSAMAMVNEGARGKTTEEMRQVMHFPENESQGEISFASAYDKFNAKGAEYTLSTANALWVDKEYPLLYNFIANIERYYHGAAENVDFKGAPEETISMINSWVEGRTGNKIKNLISRVSPDMKLIMTNAVYFKGIWVRSFDKNMTKKRNFTTDDGRIIKVPMMESETNGQRFNYHETNDMQIIELPYQGERISMIIILPTGNNIISLEKSLSLDNLTEWRKSLVESEVSEVGIPKFNLSAGYSLTDSFRALGMQTVFTNGADFSGISGRSNLLINDIVHQSFVDVNEQGTEAAATTGTANALAYRGYQGPPSFWADHPFIFLIEDKETGSILFIGRVSDPTKAN